MLRAFRLSIALSIVILVLSVISVPNLPKVEVRAADKLGHFSAYLVLSFILLFELAKKFRWSNTYRRWLIPSALLCVLYGVLMELLQATPLFDRHFDYYDMLANTIGVLVGLVLFLATSNWMKRLFGK